MISDHSVAQKKNQSRVKGTDHDSTHRREVILGKRAALRERLHANGILEQAAPAEEEEDIEEEEKEEDIGEEDTGEEDVKFEIDESK